MYLKNQLLSLLTIMTGLLLTRKWIITTRIVLPRAQSRRIPERRQRTFMRVLSHMWISNMWQGHVA